MWGCGCGCECECECECEDKCGCECECGCVGVRVSVMIGVRNALTVLAGFADCRLLHTEGLSSYDDHLPRPNLPMLEHKGLRGA